MASATVIYAAHVRGVYICPRVYEVLAHAERFGVFHLFTLFLEEFDYTTRVPRVLHTTGSS